MELLPEGLLLEAETYNALISTLRRDSRVLESFRIMDYSLLVGVHNLDLAAKEEVILGIYNSSRVTLSATIFLDFKQPFLSCYLRMPQALLVQQGQQRNNVLCKKQSYKNKNWFLIPQPWSRFKHKQSLLMSKSTYREY